MRIRTHQDAREFLTHTQTDLEADEVANGSMLGICARLAGHPDPGATAPCLKTVGDENGLVLAALMTPPHNLLVYGNRDNLGLAARLLVAELVAEGWSVPGVFGHGDAPTAVVRAWSETIGTRWKVASRQRVLVLREARMPAPENGKLRLATTDDIELVTEWSYGFERAIHGSGCLEEARRTAHARIAGRRVYLWAVGRPVSMADSNRPASHGISVSAVYTPPELRGRGYATACVGELSRLLLDRGWQYCSLFVDTENEAAKRVYAKIGYAPVCEYVEYRFRLAVPGTFARWPPQARGMEDSVE